MNSTQALEHLMRTRRLRPETISRFGIRADERLQAWAYPVKGGTRYKAWDPASSGRKYWHTPGTPNQLYGLAHIPEESREVWLVNGEPSVWACLQAGIPAVCGLMGEGNLPEDAVERLMEKGVRIVHVAFDLDRAGEEAAAVAFRKLREPLIVLVHRLPASLGPGGDVGDLYTSTGGDDGLFADLLSQLVVVPMREPWEDQVMNGSSRHIWRRRPVVVLGDRWWVNPDVLVEVVSRYVQVRKEGSRWRGLCPFHDDHAPSLVLYGDGYFHCFGCGAHGNAADFLIRVEGIPFREALHRIRSGIAGAVSFRERRR